LNQTDLATGFSQITTTDPSFQTFLDSVSTNISAGTGILKDIAQTLDATDQLVKDLQAEFGTFKQDYLLLEEVDRKRVYQAYVRITQQNTEIERVIQKMEMENTRQDRKGFYKVEQTYGLAGYYFVFWWIFCLLVVVFGVVLFTRLPEMSWMVKAGLILMLFFYPAWVLWLEAGIVWLWVRIRAWVYGVAHG